MKCSICGAKEAAVWKDNRIVAEPEGWSSLTISYGSGHMIENRTLCANCTYAVRVVLEPAGV